MALFEYSKKKQAREDYGDEGKTYTLIINSNDKASGTNNNAQFYIDLSFIPKNYQYFKMNYSFQSAGGTFKDSIIEFGATTNVNVLTIVTYDSTITGQFCALNSRVYSLDGLVNITQPTYINSYQSGIGLLGTYGLSKPLPDDPITSQTITGTITISSNTVTFASSQTGLIGKFITHSGGLPVGTRIVSGSGTTYYMNKQATSTNTSQAMVLYNAFQAKVSYGTANVQVDFGCNSYMYDNANQGKSNFLGVSQKYNQGTGSNHFNSWHEQNPSQVLNIHNSTGDVKATIYNGDDYVNGGNLLMTDTSLQTVPTPDMTPWIMAVSLTPILSSHIDTQSF